MSDPIQDFVARYPGGQKPLDTAVMHPAHPIHHFIPALYYRALAVKATLEIAEKHYHFSAAEVEALRRKLLYPELSLVSIDDICPDDGDEVSQ